MNSFNDVLDDICNKVNKESKYNDTMAHLLDYTINLWSEKINFPRNINSNIFTEIEIFSNDLYTEWKAKETEVLEIISLKFNREQKIKARFPNNQSPLNQMIKNFINQLPLRNRNMNYIKFIVFLGLIITGVSFVVSKLNKENTSTGNQRVSSSTSNDNYYFLPISQKLILIVNASKKDCLDKIKNQGNKIESEDCKKLSRATSFLWMGNKDELDKKFTNYNNYIAQPDQESEYDVFLVEIDLDEVIEGFKKGANRLDRVDAFLELNDLSVKISDRLKVSVYENTNVYSL